MKTTLFLKRTALFILTAIAVSAVASPGRGQQAASYRANPYFPEALVKGRTARVDLAEGRVEGELISATPDSLWLESGGTLMALPFSEVGGVKVKMHQWGWGRIMAWNLIAGLGSAVALTAACSSVTSDCGGVMLSWTFSWALIGGITGGVLASSQYRDVGPFAEGVRPFVRYPQGMPPPGRR